MTNSQGKFLNPYESWRKIGRSVVKFNCDVGYDDYQLIRSIRPGAGTISTTINTMYARLVNQLRERNLVNFQDLQEFEYCISNLEIKLPTKEQYEQYKQSRTANDTGTGRTVEDVKRSPLGGIGGETDAPHVGGGEKGKSAVDKAITSKQPNLASGSGKKRDGRSTGQPS